MRLLVILSPTDRWGTKTEYTRLRKVLHKDAKSDLKEYYPEFGKTLGEELLTPTKIYVKTIKHLLFNFFS